MISIKQYIQNKIWKARFALIQHSIRKAGFEIADIDENQGEILISLAANISTLLTVPKYVDVNSVIRLDCSVMFDSDFINLKILSDISEISFGQSCYIMGFTAKTPEQALVFIAKDIHYTHSCKKIGKLIDNVKVCSNSIISYLTNANKRMGVDFLDLSMFNDVDLYLFNPQFLGENKEFIFRTWDKYIEYIENNPENPMLGNTESLLPELEACKLFEETNKMILAEIGHRVFRELVWNSRFRHLLDDVYVN